jgi:hypothetical protein
LLPTSIGILPAGDLVAPELHVLRTTQTLRFLGREQKRDGGPLGLPERPFWN